MDSNSFVDSTSQSVSTHPIIKKDKKKVSDECINWVKNINKCLENCNTFDDCDKKCNIYKICSNIKK